jgi:hypothetical protein
MRQKSGPEKQPAEDAIRDMSKVDRLPEGPSEVDRRARQAVLVGQARADGSLTDENAGRLFADRRHRL